MGTQKVMPITAFTFIIGWLAIAGIPPFSGFWSKDEVLLAAWNGSCMGDALDRHNNDRVLHEQTCFHDFLRGKKKWGISEHEETEAEEETDTGDGQEHEIIPHESPTVMGYLS